MQLKRQGMLNTKDSKAANKAAGYIAFMYLCERIKALMRIFVGKSI
jgi:hypothetical protein